MKYFVLILGVIVSLKLSSQSFYPLKTDTTSIQFEISFSENKINLVSNTLSDLRKKGFATIKEVRLDETDIILNYNLLPKIEKGFHYFVDANLLENETVIDDAKQYYINGDFGEIYEFKISGKTIIWKDAIENMLDLNQAYSIMLTTQKMGALDCENYPTFSLKEQVPHYVAVGVGIGLLGLGNNFYKLRNDEYKKYQQFWSDGEAEDIANEALDIAESHQNTAKILTVSGWGVLGINAILYSYRMLRTKSKQKLFNEYCRDSKKFSLNLQTSSTSGVVGFEQISANLSIQF